MAEVEVEGSGVMDEGEESLEHVQQWDEDVVDLEFKSGHNPNQFRRAIYGENLFHLLQILLKTRF